MATLATQILDVISALFIIFGGVLGYIPQYRKIAQLRSSEGFSKLVCLVLLLANILRLLFRIGKEFDDSLVFQVRTHATFRTR